MPSTVDHTVVRLEDFRSDALRDLGSKVHSVAKMTDGLVRSSPWAAAGALAVAGMAVGVLAALGTQRVMRRAAQGHADASSELAGG